MSSNRVLRAVLCCIFLIFAAAYGFTSTASAIAYEAAPEIPGTGVPIVYGDSQFQSDIAIALDYLHQGYPEKYALVTRWVTEIRPTDTYTRIDSTGVCYLDEADATASYYWLAGILIHEAQHTADDNGYFLSHAYTARESEARALEVQAAYLGSINSWTGKQTREWIDGYLATNYWETIPVKYGDEPLK